MYCCAHARFWVARVRSYFFCEDKIGELVCLRGEVGGGGVVWRCGLVGDS